MYTPIAGHAPVAHYLRICMRIQTGTGIFQGLITNIIAAIKILQRAYISFHPNPRSQPTKSGRKTYSTRVLAAPALPSRHRCLLFAKRKKYLRSENTSVVCAAVLIHQYVYKYTYILRFLRGI